MKLLHKLLPVATIASITAVVAPVVTSCACSTSNGSWTKGETYKPMKPKKSKKIQGNNNDLTKAYEKDVKTNNKIFSDDFVNFISRGGYTTTEAMKFDVSSINHQTTYVGDGFESPTEAKNDEYILPISFTMTFSADASVITASGAKTNLKYNNAKIVFTKMPVHFMYIESQEVLGKTGSIAQCNAVSPATLTSNKEWSIEMPAIEYDKNTDSFALGENKTYTYASAKELGEYQCLMNAFVSFLRFFTMFESNYYYNIELA